MGGWMDGRAGKVEKNHVFSKYIKKYSNFFLVVSLNLRKGFKTFSEKNFKKIKRFKYVKNFFKTLLRGRKITRKKY